MDSSTSITLYDVVLVGGGHSHVHVLKMFGMLPLSHVRLTLISKDYETPYSGMIPGYIAGRYSRDECHIDLFQLCSFAKARFISTEAIGIDCDSKLVKCTGRPPIRYDVLSIDIGIVPRPLPLSASRIEHNLHDYNITSVKPIDRLAIRWQIVLERIQVAINKKETYLEPFTVCIVGAGAGGVELSFSINHSLRECLEKKGLSRDMIKVLLVSKNEDVLTSHSSKAIRNLAKLKLREKSIELILSANIVGLRPTSSDNEKCHLLAEDGREIPYDEVFWCTQAMAPEWLQSTGLELDADGCIKVLPTLQTTKYSDIFASGDVCHNIKYPRPKAGVFAVRAGPPLFRNLRRWLQRDPNDPLEDWEPQDEFLGIVGLGDRNAIASKGGMALEGEYLWKLKDQIDRAWMGGYQNLPTMESMASSAASAASIAMPQLRPEAQNLLKRAQMRCAGCGSKVGSSVLERALSRARAKDQAKRADIVAGIGDDAAVVRPPGDGSCIVQTIDYFKSFISDPFLFGQISANHALSDIFAMNAKASTAMALCVLPFAPEQKMEDELTHMIAGALDVLKSENCSLVGGHTSEGADPAMGLSVSGYVDLSRALHKGPLQLDHVIVLTKPLGTGILLAAAMQHRTRGSWARVLFRSMLQSNSIAASILAKHNCGACTDVTGFGFLGHLLEMLHFTRDASSDSESALILATPANAKVTIELSRLPLLPGALQCATNGILSSLYPQNYRSSQAIANLEEVAFNPVFGLLFDPQTSGGLLATVPKYKAEEVIEELRAAGFADSAVVGEITAHHQSASEASNSHNSLGPLLVINP